MWQEHEDFVAFAGDAANVDETSHLRAQILWVVQIESGESRLRNIGFPGWSYVPGGSRST